MLRAILNAIRAAARSIWQAGLWMLNFTFSLPGAVVRGVLGGGGGPAPLPQPEAGASPKAEREARAQGHLSAARDAQREMASVAWKIARARVAGESLMSERVERLMSTVSSEVRAWLDCLDPQELERLAGAGISRVTGHVSGQRPMHGVRKVGEWRSAKSPRRTPTDDEFNAAFGLTPSLA